MPDPTYEEAQRALSRARALRDSLRRAADTTRHALAADAAERPQHPSWLISRLRHPLWSLGTIARMPMRLAPVRTAARQLDHWRRRSEPLPLTLPHHAWTEARRESGALHWLGPVTIRHRTLTALLCQPATSGASIRCRMTATPGATFRCACGVAPRAWQARPPAIEFAIRIASATRDWTRQTRVRIDVTTRITDRRWHDMRIDLPELPEAGEEIVITLSTSVALGSDAAHADALFAEPRLVWRR